MSHELQAELLRLKAQKAKAVEEEDYEAAAVLKRKIKVLEDTEASLRVDYGPLPQHAQHAEPEKAALKEVKEALKEVSLLDRYAPDLSSLAEEGLLEPFQGRSSLVQRLERSLARRLKPNVLLVGDPGTGKTALVEALAQRLPRTTSPWLRGKRIRRLDVARLTAGTRLRGDFEERLQLVLQNLEVEPVINTMSDSKCMYELKTYL